MDSMEINKAAAAILVAGIAFMGASLISQALVSPTPLKTSAIKIDLPAAPGAAAPPPEVPIAVLLASADAKAGQADVGSAGCVACHSFNEGGKAGIGPNLYGVLGSKIGSHMDGYAYSAALKGKGGEWSYEALNSWLAKPAAFAPGTKMTYAGLTDAKKRAEVIAYLRSLSGSPLPLPAAPAASAAAAPAPAAAPAGPAPIAERLASADADRGKAAMAQQGCIACHTLNEGGKAGIGPNLYGVYGAKEGSHMEGYAYSSAMKAKTGNWTPEELDAWLTKPAAFAPGTKMTFVGVSDAGKRADIIAYLKTLGGS